MRGPLVLGPRCIAPAIVTALLLSQHRVLSRKTVRSRALCVGYDVRTWYATCSMALHSQCSKKRDPICTWTNGIAQHQLAGD